MEFINRHRQRLQTISYNDRAFFSFSSSEIPAAYFLFKPTDLDFMIYRIDICAVPSDKQPPKGFKGQVLKIYPKGLAVGYVRLKNSTPNGESAECEQGYYKQAQKFGFDTVHGPAVTTTVGWSVLTFDRVFAIQCPYWPPEAQKWQTRHRPYGWPSKHLINQIVSEGCFLVGKTHPNCKENDETQWRYSFSKAEARLISSWTDSQMYVYHVLRLINSIIDKEGNDWKKTGLCTYHLKTQMFWACEEKPTEFWEDGNLFSSVTQLLSDMEQHISARNLLNYFLPDCNIIEGCIIEDDLRERIRLLNTDLGRSLFRSMLPPKLCHGCCISVSCPATVFLYIHLWAKRFGAPFLSDRPKLIKVQQLLDEELDDLMNGIYNMQLGKTLDDSYYVNSEEHFLKVVKCPETIVTRRAVMSNRASLNPIASLYESLDKAEFFTLEDGNNKWDFSAAISCATPRCPYAGKSPSVPWNEESGIFEKKWVSPSRLLCAAYLSNLYFTTGSYVKCIELIKEEHQLALDANFTEFFPMIFCPELASLFDENIQTILGFLWLFKHLSGGEENFEFCTCPQLFLLAIRLQISIKLENVETLEKNVFHFFEHRRQCKFGLHLCSDHSILLEMALNLSWKLYEEMLPMKTLYQSYCTKHGVVDAQFEVDSSCGVALC